MKAKQLVTILAVLLVLGALTSYFCLSIFVVKLPGAQATLIANRLQTDIKFLDSPTAVCHRQNLGAAVPSPFTTLSDSMCEWGAARNALDKTLFRLPYSDALYQLTL